jgi:hypothetical protein
MDTIHGLDLKDTFPPFRGFFLGNSKESHVPLTTGAERWGKGIPQLIQALAMLPPVNGREPLLLCVGGPRQVVPAYCQLAREVGVPERRLHFVDRVPNREVPL